ncbi:MAG: hypothetical protein HZC44_04600 [Geobacter sp.]|nr:hypothetical protein [Geobacter sp.]
METGCPDILHSGAMVTIVIISNDSHVLLLKERFQPLITAQICIFSDFEQGMVAVFDKRPAAVFIQREIGGTTAEVIAKQIKGLLRDASPRIVLMGDLEGQKGERPSCFDDSFDFASSEEELCAFFGTQLKKIPHLRWKEGDGPADWGGVTPEVIPVHQELYRVEDHAVSAPGSGVEPQERSADTPPTAISHPPESSVAVGQGGERPVEPVPAGVDGQPLAVAPRSVSSPQPPAAGESASAGAASPQRPRPPAAPSRPRPASPPHPEMQVEELPPFESLFGQEPRQHSLPLFAAAALLGVLILGISVYGVARLPVIQSLFRTAPTPAQPQPAAPAVQAVVDNRSTAQSAQRASLPRLISPDRKDVAYSTTHPGWERFFSPGMEFRVFRSGSDIKAIQVIAAGEKGIGEEVVAGLLQDLLGSGDYSATSRARKKDYLVDQATLANGAELALYRKSDGGGIRGVVVTLP